MKFTKAKDVDDLIKDCDKALKNKKTSVEVKTTLCGLRIKLEELKTQLKGEKK
jgi:hypothetical protein